MVWWDTLSERDESLSPTETKSFPEPGTAVVLSLLSVAPTHTSVFLHESKVSQAQWGRRMFSLSVIDDGTPDDSSLLVVLDSTVRGAPISSGKRTSLPVGCPLFLG